MMKVIDISAWQENVDWQAVKDAGIEGVILKIGEHSHLDDMFVDHINKAVENGLQFGVYYFATLAPMMRRWLRLIRWLHG